MKPLYLALVAALAFAWLTGSIDSPVLAKCDRLSALPWLRCAPNPHQSTTPAGE